MMGLNQATLFLTFISEGRYCFRVLPWLTVASFIPLFDCGAAMPGLCQSKLSWRNAAVQDTPAIRWDSRLWEYRSLELHVFCKETAVDFKEQLGWILHVTADVDISEARKRTAVISFNACIEWRKAGCESYYTYLYLRNYRILKQ